MHFRCTQCPAEFCSGCNNLFRKAEVMITKCIADCNILCY